MRAAQSGASNKNRCVRGPAVLKQQITLDFGQKTPFIPLFSLDFDTFGPPLQGKIKGDLCFFGSFFIIFY